MRRLALLALLGVGFASGACGGDDDGGDKKDPGTFATEVCTAAGDWVRAIQGRAGEIGNELGPTSSPQQGKEVLQDFLDDTITDTEKFGDDIEAAGVPDAEGGEQMASDLKGVADEAKGVLRQARSQADRLPVDDQQQFGVEARKLGSAAGDSLRRLGPTFQKRRPSELQKAFTETSACRELRGS
jgi:hypothetical protein